MMKKQLLQKMFVEDIHCRQSSQGHLRTQPDVSLCRRDISVLRRTFPSNFGSLPYSAGRFPVILGTFRTQPDVSQGFSINL